MFTWGTQISCYEEAKPLHGRTQLRALLVATNGEMVHNFRKFTASALVSLTLVDPKQYRNKLPS